ALFAFNIAPDSGPGLLFVTIPNMLESLPGGLFFGLFFFLLITIAALTTAVGLVETIVANMCDLTGISRLNSVIITLVLMFILAIPSILSQGPWSHILLFGMDIFGFIDYISGNVILTVGGLILSLYVAIQWKFENYQNDLNIGSGNLKVVNIMKPFVNFIIPASIIIILITSIF